MEDIIDTLIAELRELPNGTETTIYQLVKQCGFDADQLEEEYEMFAIYGEVIKAAKKAHITLDWSKFKNMVVGLPYNIPFVVKNTRGQIKCPRCGSRRTARILYGMPAMDEKLDAKIQEGKVFLGGCCISGFDARYYCNECRKKFGSCPTISDEDTIGLMPDAITAVYFSRTEYLKPYQPTRVSVLKTENGATVNVRGLINDMPIEKEYRIRKKKWDGLVEALYSDLYLNDWRHSFNDYSILDGEEWSLEIKLGGNRKRTYSGMNGYPPYWEELLQLFRPFIQQAGSKKYS